MPMGRDYRWIKVKRVYWS